MTPSANAAVAANEISETTLLGVPARTLKFLQGAGASGIRSALAAVGWNATHIEEAWALLTALKATHVVAPAPQGDAVLEAIAACEAWQATSLVRARARLSLSFPEQGAFLFADMVPGKGMEAVLNIATFLARRHTLASGNGRKATRKVDHEALALLEETGITKEETIRLAGLLGKAQDVAVPDLALEEAKRLDAERLVVLRKLYTWLSAWSDIARTVVTRRDELIRLGLAKRRSSKAPPPVATPAPPPVEEEPAPESRAA